MKPAARTRNLIQFLGWQGGTVHQACAEVGLDVQEFLHGEAQFDENGPSFDFQRGYYARRDNSETLSDPKWKGNLEFWFGVIAAIQNECRRSSIDP